MHNVANTIFHVFCIAPLGSQSELWYLNLISVPLILHKRIKKIKNTKFSRGHNLNDFTSFINPKYVMFSAD